MEDTKKPVVAKAKYGLGRRIIVDECPYCGDTHEHGFPAGEGYRTAECMRGEYKLDFSTDREDNKK